MAPIEGHIVIFDDGSEVSDSIYEYGYKYTVDGSGLLPADIAVTKSILSPNKTLSLTVLSHRVDTVSPYVAD